jgi:polygalacturonase
VWSWPENSVDGINPVSCNHFTIDSCFIRACDDCISIKSRTAPSFNITVTNNVMVGWAWSDGVNTLESTPTSAPCDSILVKNCDILYSRGGSPSGHAAINWSVDGAATIQNIRVEDVRCEEKCENDLQVQVTNGAVWAGSTPGHLKGVYFKNITWENTAGSFKLIGYSANNLAEDITFDNCYVGNKLLTSTSDAAFQVNQYVKNVRFINSGTGARPSSESTARPVLRVTTKKNSGLLSVAINRPGIHAVSISSLSGRDLKCFKGAGENEFAIKTGEFGAGIYVIHSEIDGKCASQLLINR